jgi:hypothetical protein
VVALVGLLSVASFGSLLQPWRTAEKAEASAEKAEVPAQV